MSCESDSAGSNVVVGARVCKQVPSAAVASMIMQIVDIVL